MNRLPNKIEPCPIEEAVLDIRFSSEYPVDAVFGVLYTKIKDFFDEEVVSLPILQLPESVRTQDPSLKYRAYHKISKENITLGIGPRVLTFINLSPYEGWDKWSTLFYKVLKKVIETNVIDEVERIGLRYINLFNESIFDKVKCEIKFIDTVLSEESTNLRTEIIDGKFIKILQIGNSVNLLVDNIVSKRSTIDIDCLYKVENGLSSFGNYKKVIEDAHTKEKELFFSLLKDSFLGELHPKYGE